MTSNALDVLDFIKNKFQPDNPDLEKLRADFDDISSPFSSQIRVKILKDEDAPIPSYWIVTPQSSPHKVILFFHGGLFHLGSTKGYQDLCGNLAKHTGFTIFSVDYRLAPENPFPAAVEDCLNSFLWLLEEGFNSKDIIIAGISGGGTLTLSTVLALNKRKNLLPSGVVCMSPAVDLNFPVVYEHLKDVRDWIDQKQLEEVQRLYLQGQNANHPLASPIYGDLDGLPPLLLQAGGRELLLCDINRFRDQALKKEVKVEMDVWQGMFHSFQIFYSQLPEAKGALRSIGEFVRKL